MTSEGWRRERFEVIIGRVVEEQPRTAGRPHFTAGTPDELAGRLSPAIDDTRVLRALAAIPRERFVLAELRDRAYENAALPIGCGQTISQPLVVARMLEALRLHPSDRVLDVGTGSGWHAALLAALAGHVWSVERHAELLESARAALASLGVDNVTLCHADGTAGLPEHAPFDAINVAAASSAELLRPLMAQLTPGGRLVAPLGDSEQRLTLLRRVGEDFERTPLDPVRFVPLVPGEP